MSVIRFPEGAGKAYEGVSKSFRTETITRVFHHRTVLWVFSESEQVSRFRGLEI
jgi:hypothetical protein